MYEDGAAGDGAGGNDNGGNQGTGEGASAAAAAPGMSEADLKELQELRAFKQSIVEKEPTKTPEELQKLAEQEKGAFIKYSVDEGLMKVDDFHTYENLKSTADRDLVYKNWLTNWKEENPDVDPEDIQSRAKADFEDEYKLNSTNEKAKARGEARLAKEAAEVRNPLQSAYEKSQESFKTYKAVQENFPKFNKFMDDLIKEAVPEQIAFKTKEGEDDIVIEGAKVTEEDRKEILATFKTEKAYLNYIKNLDKPEEVKMALAKKIDGFLKVKYFDQVNAKTAETFKGIGLKQGSAVGASQPFGVIKDGKSSGEGGGGSKETLQQSNDKIAGVRERMGY
jgi:hypothetical protein